MTRYACSSVKGFVPVGGVCKGHSVNDEPADPEYSGLSVDCPVCEPILAGHALWASSPEEVPLTAAEEKKLERELREIELEAVLNAKADREFARQQRLAAQKAEAAPKAPAKPAPRTRSKASGASA